MQLVGTAIASSITFSTALWLLESVENTCDVDKLPEGIPGTCPGFDITYNMSITRSVVGPLRMFHKVGLYESMNYFLVGFLAPIPVWISLRERSGSSSINMPIILRSARAMPPARAANYTKWFIVEIFFNFVVYGKYILSA